MLVETLLQLCVPVGMCVGNFIRFLCNTFLQVIFLFVAKKCVCNLVVGCVDSVVQLNTLGCLKKYAQLVELFK